MYQMPPHNWTGSHILHTHTPSDGIGCEQLGHTTESRSRGICQCDGLFGFPGDIKVAWLHVLGASGVYARVCALLVAGGRRCVNIDLVGDFRDF